MNNISVVVAVICISALGCSIVNIVAPEGSTKKILNIVLGAFVLCSMIVPIKNTINDFNVNIEISKPTEDLVLAGENAYNEAIILETQNNLESTLKAYLKNNNITADSFEIMLNTYEDGGIYIEKIDIYLTKEQQHLVSEISRLTKEKFDVKPNILLR